MLSHTHSLSSFLTYRSSHTHCPVVDETAPCLQVEALEFPTKTLWLKTKIPMQSDSL